MSARKEFLTYAGVGLVLVWVMPFLIPTYTLTVMIIYGLLALSLGLIWGFGGILCFGQAAFFGLGAYSYAVAAINFGESTFPLILSILVPALFAAVLGLMIFYGNLKDVYLGVITLVVTLILFKLINSTSGPQYMIGKARLGGFNGIPGFQTLNVPGNPNAYIYGDNLYYLSAAILFIMLILVSWLLRSSFGRISIAIRENEERVSLLGYDVRARKTSLFAIGAAIAGLAGGLIANWGEIVTPSLFSMGQSAEIIIWCIVGGLGTRLGPIFGAAGLAYLKVILGQQSLIDNTLLTGLILVLFVLFLPKGVVPEIEKIMRSVFRPRRGKTRRSAMRHSRPTRVEKEASHHG